MENKRVEEKSGRERCEEFGWMPSRVRAVAVMREDGWGLGWTVRTGGRRTLGECFRERREERREDGIILERDIVVDVDVYV